MPAANLRTAPKPLSPPVSSPSRYFPLQHSRRNDRSHVVYWAMAILFLFVGLVVLNMQVPAKNLERSELLAKQRVISIENAALQSEIASLSTTPRIEEIATKKLGLIPSPELRFVELEAPRSPADPLLAARGGPSLAYARMP